jgi:hypothetical protein
MLIRFFFKVQVRVSSPTNYEEKPFRVSLVVSVISTVVWSKLVHIMWLAVPRIYIAYDIFQSPPTPMRFGPVIAMSLFDATCLAIVSAGQVFRGKPYVMWWSADVDLGWICCGDEGCQQDRMYCLVTELGTQEYDKSNISCSNWHVCTLSYCSLEAWRVKAILET